MRLNHLIICISMFVILDSNINTRISNFTCSLESISFWERLTVLSFVVRLGLLLRGSIILIEHIIVESKRLSIFVLLLFCNCWIALRILIFRNNVAVLTNVSCWRRLWPHILSWMWRLSLASIRINIFGTNLVWRIISWLESILRFGFSGLLFLRITLRFSSSYIIVLIRFNGIF